MEGRRLSKNLILYKIKQKRLIASQRMDDTTYRHNSGEWKRFVDDNVVYNSAPFGLSADDYNELQLFEGRIEGTPGEIRNAEINYLMALYGKGPVDWVIMWETLLSQLPRRKKRISIKVLHKNAIQLQPYLFNVTLKKQTYETAGLQEEVMFGSCGLGNNQALFRQ
ncbi:hypothetical protein C1645_817654 [Glomus cerebriforme]|uniref:Uncharacterized protein n=1 Tax=Glomus cerebriforme TaxID=658196 RepID=A0A397TIB4_9GLOM|nr:hypothetical protein C1645_817654 [Glomus cerebriforme]